MFRLFICWFVYFFLFVCLFWWGVTVKSEENVEALRDRWANLRKRFRHENNGRKDALRIFRFLKVFFFFWSGHKTKNLLMNFTNWSWKLTSSSWSCTLRDVTPAGNFDDLFPYGILFIIITFCPFKNSNITSPIIFWYNKGIKCSKRPSSSSKQSQSLPESSTSVALVSFDTEEKQELI